MVRGLSETVNINGSEPTTPRLTVRCMLSPDLFPYLSEHTAVQAGEPISYLVPPCLSASLATCRQIGRLIKFSKKILSPPAQPRLSGKMIGAFQAALPSEVAGLLVQTNYLTRGLGDPCPLHQARPLENHHRGLKPMGTRPLVMRGYLTDFRVEPPVHSRDVIALGRTARCSSVRLGTLPLR